MLAVAFKDLHGLGLRCWWDCPPWFLPILPDSGVGTYSEFLLSISVSHCWITDILQQGSHHLRSINWQGPEESLFCHGIRFLEHHPSRYQMAPNHKDIKCGSVLKPGALRTRLSQFPSCINGCFYYFSLAAVGLIIIIFLYMYTVCFYLLNNNHHDQSLGIDYPSNLLNK